MLGCYLVVGGYQFDLLRLNKVGIISGVISSLFFTFYALCGERGLKKYDSWTLILYGFGFGALFYWILISPIKFITPGFPLKMWLAFVYIAIFATLLPFGFYFKGVSESSHRATITATWEPVVAGLTAYIFLGEVLYPLQVLGGIGVIAAVVLLQIGREKAAPSAPLEIREKSETNTNARNYLHVGQGFSLV
jgi:drug/metabolite transporter (DMT)-like permease